MNRMLIKAGPGLFLALFWALSVTAAAGEDRPMQPQAATIPPEAGPERAGPGKPVQRILLDRMVSAGGLKLFPVLGDDKSYLYVPDKARLATQDESGAPVFSFVRYVRNERAAAGERDREGDGAGVVTAQVTLAVSDEQLERARAELSGMKPGAKIVGPCMFTDGTFSLNSVVKESSGKIVSKVCAMGKAPLLENQSAAVSILLNKEGTQILWETFNTPAPNISFDFEMELQGYHSPYSATLEADWDKIYQNTTFDAGLSHRYLGAEINLAFESLRRSGAIKLDVVGSDAEWDRRLQSAYDILTRMMFDKVDSSGSNPPAEGSGKQALAEPLPEPEELAALDGDGQKPEAQPQAQPETQGQPLAAGAKQELLERATALLQNATQNADATKAKNDKIREENTKIREQNAAIMAENDVIKEKQRKAADAKKAADEADKKARDAAKALADLEKKKADGSKGDGDLDRKIEAAKAASAAAEKAAADAKAEADKSKTDDAKKAAEEAAKKATEAARAVTDLEKQKADAATSVQDLDTKIETAKAAKTAADEAARAARENADKLAADAPKLKPVLDEKELLSGESRPPFALVASFRMKRVKQSGKFRINFNKYTPARVVMPFSQNIGDLRRLLKTSHFRSVNLDDPFYQQREIVAYVDGDVNSQDFGQYVNYVTVTMRKKHGGGDLTTDEIRIDRSSFNEKANKFSLLYGWKGDNDRSRWLDYEYRAVWSFFGGRQVEQPWRAAQDPAIPLMPPFKRRLVSVEADPQLVDTAAVRAISIKVYYETGSGEQVRQITLNTFKKVLSGEVAFMVPWNEPEYGYEVLYHLRGDQTVSSGRRRSSSDALILDELPRG